MSYGQPQDPNYNNMPYPQAAPRNDKDNFAIAALVVGVFNLCTWIIPLCGCPMALLGIGLGAYSLESNNRTLAMIGLGLSILGFIATIGSAILGVALQAGS